MVRIEGWNTMAGKNAEAGLKILCFGVARAKVRVSDIFVIQDLRVAAENKSVFIGICFVLMWMAIASLFFTKWEPQA